MMQIDQRAGPDRCPIKTLMVIDDDSFDQLICKRVTVKSGLVRDLLQYIDAEKALDYLSHPDSRTPDLILLDINMPKMNGFEFLEAVQERFGTDLCPIVVMLDTSLDPKGEKRANRFPMVQGFMNKPLSKNDFQVFIGMLPDIC
ncbi:MAG: response regulator [Sulfitobacter sp.]